tara:strand:+ start:3830 stop:5086 length:1257 start_codon:yes stop_codon:yes gene_type:complete
MTIIKSDYHKVAYVISASLISGGCVWLTYTLLSVTLSIVDFAAFSLTNEFILLSVAVMEGAFISAYIFYSKNEDVIIQNIFFNYLFKLRFFYVSLCIFFVCLFLYFFYEDKSNFFYFLICIPAVYILSAISMISAYFQQKDDFRYLAFIRLLPNVIRLLFIAVITFIFFGENLSLWIIFLIIIISSFTSYFLIKKTMVVNVRNNFSDSVEKNSVNNFLFKMIFLGLISVLITKVDILMLAKLSTSLEVAIYSIAYSYAKLFTVVSLAINSVMVNKAAGIETIYEYKKYFKLSFSLSISLSFLLLLVSTVVPYIMHFTLDEHYYSSENVYAIMVYSLVVEIFFIPLVVILTKKKAFKFLLYLNFLLLILNVILDYYFIPIYGAYGASLTTLVIRCVGSSFIIIYLAIRLKNEKNYGSIQ